MRNTFLSRERTVLIAVVLLFAGSIGPGTAVAGTFAVIGEPGTIAQDLAQRISINTGTGVVLLTMNDAYGLPASAWSNYRVVWLVAPSQADATVEPIRPWYDLTRPEGALGQFVRNGGTLVLLAPHTSSIGLDVSPSGDDFFPHSAETASASTVQAPDHPLVTGAGYGGLHLSDSDFNEPPPQGESAGCWLFGEGAEATVIAGDAHSATVAEIPSGQGRILLVGVFAPPSGSLVSNLIGYTNALAQSAARLAAQ